MELLWLWGCTYTKLDGKGLFFCVGLFAFIFFYFFRVVFFVAICFGVCLTFFFFENLVVLV